MTLYETETETETAKMHYTSPRPRLRPLSLARLETRRESRLCLLFTVRGPDHFFTILKSGPIILVIHTRLMTLLHCVYPIQLRIRLMIASNYLVLCEDLANDCKCMLCGGLKCPNASIDKVYSPHYASAYKKPKVCYGHQTVYSLLSSFRQLLQSTVSTCDSLYPPLLFWELLH